MSESILPADWAPGLGNQDDGTPGITTAVTIYSDVPGRVSEVTFFTTTTVSGTYTAGAWLVNAADDPSPSGSDLQFQTYPGLPAAGQRVAIAFSPPIDIAANTLYRFGVHNTAGRYVFKSGDFASAKVSASGKLHAPANGDNPTGLGPVAQANFSIGAMISYPANSGGGNGYGIDVTFLPLVPPAAGSAPAGLAYVVAGAGSAPNLPPAAGVGPGSIALATAAAGAAPAVPLRAGSAAAAVALTLAGAGQTPALPADGTAAAALAVVLAGAGETPEQPRGTRGPRLISRNGNARIVTRTRVV